jgi:glutamate racemase
LFKHDCTLVIVACNTASAEALRKIQQEYLPAHYPDRRVLGVLIPAAEEAVARSRGKIGVIATLGTVHSQAYPREIRKLNAEIRVMQQAAPLLVPLIENEATRYAEPILRDYLAPLLAERIDTLILGCTHYPLLGNVIQKIVGDEVQLISQADIVPEKLAKYLGRHAKFDARLSRHSSRKFLVTDLAPSVRSAAEQLFGAPINLEHIEV